MTEIIGGFTAFSQRAANASKRERYAREEARPDQVEPRTFDVDQLKEIAGTDRRWAWVEVDLNAIRHNCSAVRQRIGRTCHMMAVVGSDAYGHGAVRVAKTALNSGADHLGVSTIDEAIALREGEVNAPILLLSEPPRSAIPLLLAYKVMPSVYTMEFAIQYGETADLYGQKAPYHLMVNTGMNSLGVNYGEVVTFLSQVGFHRALELKGVFTEFATAGSPDMIDFQKQATRFGNAVNDIHAAGFNPGIIHAADSAATLVDSKVHFDMVRIGSLLYGYVPDQAFRGMIALKPALSVHARIVDVHMVPVGEGVGRGLSYRSPGSVKACTLPIGYADGFPRALSGRTGVIYQGSMLRQIGQIGIDQCMFEIDLRSRAGRKRLDPQVGDEVALVGSFEGLDIPLEELAAMSSASPIEFCMGLSARLPRVYV